MFKRTVRAMFFLGLLGAGAAVLLPVASHTRNSEPFQIPPDLRDRMLSAVSDESQYIDNKEDIKEIIPEIDPEPTAESLANSSSMSPKTRTLRMLVTAYCPCEHCCGRFSDGKTASGRSISTNGGMFVAADTRLLPFGIRLSIPGYYQGAPVPVLDRGSRIKGQRLDVFFRSHSQARRWGSRWLDVTVYLD